MMIRKNPFSEKKHRKNVFLRKLFDFLFIPYFELTLLKNLSYLSSRLIIITFPANRRCFRTW